MNTIILIQPPIQDFYLTKKRTIPYGLMAIAANLINAGFEVELIDSLATKKSKKIPLPTEMEYLREYYTKPDVSPFSLFYHYQHYGYSLEYIVSRVKQTRPFLVGISSLFSSYADQAFAVAEFVKKAIPECKIVMGGHHPTSLPEESLKHPGVDFVIRGEGETSMTLLAKSLQNGRLTDRSIPGLCFMEEQNKAIIQSPTQHNNLDDLPLPAIQLINNKFYQRKSGGSTVITASRGCTLKCTYCSTNAESFQTFRQRSLASILHEIDRAIERGVRFVDFEDENLSFKKNWFIELLHELQKRSQDYNLEFRAMNGLLPTTLDREMIKKMKAAGFKELNLSLCTTDSNQLKRFSRPNVTKSFEKTVAMAKELDLSAVGYIIIGAPFQEAESSLKDLLFLAERHVLAGLSVYYPVPGTKDYDVCKQEGLLPSKLSLTRSTALPLSHHTNRLEVTTLLRLGRIVNYMKSIKLLPGSKKSVLNKTDGPEKEILRQFLEDGKIRGIDTNGDVFQHKTAENLTKPFIKAINSKISLSAL